MTTLNVAGFMLGLLVYYAALIVLPFSVRPNFDQLLVFVVSWIIGGGALIFGVLLVFIVRDLPRTRSSIVTYAVGSALIAAGIVAAGLALTYLVVQRGNRLDVGLNIRNAGWLWLSLALALLWLLASGIYLQRSDGTRGWIKATVGYHLPVEMTPGYMMRVKVGADGELVEVAQTSEEGVIELRGTGNRVTQVVYLEEGRYQLEYAFSGALPCEIILVSVDNIDITNIPIVQRFGVGSKTFGVLGSGRYVFEIRCPFEGSIWNFRCWLL